MAAPVTAAAGFGVGVPKRLFEGPFLAPYAVMPDEKGFIMIERHQARLVQHVNLVLNWLVDLQTRVRSKS